MKTVTNMINSHLKINARKIGKLFDTFFNKTILTKSIHIIMAYTMFTNARHMPIFLS